MAKSKKKKLEKEIPEEPKEKKPGIFDLISYLTDQKKPWDQLTLEEQKLFNPYMINRFFSMELGLIEAINDLQKYTLIIDKKEVYNLYLALLPQQRFYLKYIKATKEIPERDVNILIRHFSVSRSEAEEYYLTLTKTEEGEETLDEIKQNYVFEKFEK